MPPRSAPISFAQKLVYLHLVHHCPSLSLCCLALGAFLVGCRPHGSADATHRASQHCASATGKVLLHVL